MFSCIAFFLSHAERAEFAETHALSLVLGSAVGVILSLSEPLGRRPRRQPWLLSPRRQPKGLKSRISQNLFLSTELKREFRHVFCACFARACLRDANTRQSRHTRVKRCVLLFKFLFKFVLTTNHPGGCFRFRLRFRSSEVWLTPKLH